MLLEDQDTLHICSSINFHLVLTGQLGDSVPPGCLHRGLGASSQAGWSTSSGAGGVTSLRAWTTSTGSSQCGGAAELHRDPLISLNSSLCRSVRPAGCTDTQLDCSFLFTGESKWLQKDQAPNKVAQLSLFSTTMPLLHLHIPTVAHGNLGQSIDQQGVWRCLQKMDMSLHSNFVAMSIIPFSNSNIVLTKKKSEESGNTSTVRR